MCTSSGFGWVRALRHAWRGTYDCQHSWAIIKEVEVFAPEPEASREHPMAYEYILRCDHCGEIQYRSDDA